MLSVAGAVVLVILCGTTAAVLLYSGKIPPLSKGDGPRLGIGIQSGGSESPSGYPSASPSVSSGAPGGPGEVPAGGGPATPGTRIKATYRTVALLDVVGFDTEVTVTAPASVTWTVVLVMPANILVENRSTGEVRLVQDGLKVTLTPIGPHGNTTFTVRFPGLLTLGKSVTSCTVNGDPCTGL
jgi:hypothetical protein